MKRMVSAICVTSTMITTRLMMNLTHTNTVTSLRPSSAPAVTAESLTACLLTVVHLTISYMSAPQTPPTTMVSM
jgi:hypothetical protein